MTPCENLGYKVGDKFEVVGDSSSSSFIYGETVELILDDDSGFPRFSRLSDGSEQWLLLKDVKKITTDNHTDINGWIKWEGGKCPVEKGTLVDVKYRDGNRKYSLPAGVSIDDSVPNAHEAYWHNDSNGWDIIAYRLSNTGRAGSAPTEIKTTNNADAFAIVNLISGVCPELKVEDALEIASTLIDAGFKR